MMFSEILLPLVVLAFTSYGEASSLFPEGSAGYSGAIVWGSNHIGSHDLNPAHHEPSLRHLCDTRDDIQVIFIGGILSHTTPYVLPIKSVRADFPTFKDNDDGLRVPGLTLGNHCMIRNKRLHLAEGASPSPLSLLSCPNVGADIAYCQVAKKKKIFLNVSNMVGEATFKSPEDAERAAWAYWQLFLGGKALLKDRPFGPSIILDGLNLIARDSPDHNDVFLIKLRQLMDAALNDAKEPQQFYLSASPKCSFPDTFLGEVLDTGKNLFDLVVVEFTSSTECSFARQALFWNTLEKWNAWANHVDFSSTNQTIPVRQPALLIGLPAAKVGGLGAPGDFVSLEEFSRYHVARQLQSFRSVKGVYFLDYSSDNLNLPCTPVGAPAASKKRLASGKKNGHDEDVLPYKSYSALLMSALNAVNNNELSDFAGMRDLQVFWGCALRPQKDADAYWQLPDGFRNYPDPEGPVEEENYLTNQDGDDADDAPVSKAGLDTKDYGCGPGVRKCFRPKGHKVRSSLHESSDAARFVMVAVALAFILI